MKNDVVAGFKMSDTLSEMRVNLRFGEFAC